jgi:hypothetical protein
MKIIILLLVVIVLLPITYYTLSPLFIKKIVNEQLPAGTQSDSTDNQLDSKSFKIVDTATHPASGEVRIVTSNTGTYIRYENFKTINGPDLFIYLANDLEAKDYISLGELRATEGNVNYLIPEGTDVTKYKYVMVWCKQFSVLFNYADISEI